MAGLSGQVVPGSALGDVEQFAELAEDGLAHGDHTGTSEPPGLDGTTTQGLGAVWYDQLLLELASFPNSIASLAGTCRMVP